MLFGQKTKDGLVVSVFFELRIIGLAALIFEAGDDYFIKYGFYSQYPLPFFD